MTDVDRGACAYRVEISDDRRWSLQSRRESLSAVTQGIEEVQTRDRYGRITNPVGAAGAGMLPTPVPTKLVTLEARRVAVKAPAETGRADC